MVGRGCSARFAANDNAPCQKKTNGPQRAQLVFLSDNLSTTPRFTAFAERFSQARQKPKGTIACILEGEARVVQFDELHLRGLAGLVRDLRCLTGQDQGGRHVARSKNVLCSKQAAFPQRATSRCLRIWKFRAATFGPDADDFNTTHPVAAAHAARPGRQPGKGSDHGDHAGLSRIAFTRMEDYKNKD